MKRYFYLFVFAAIAFLSACDGNRQSQATAATEPSVLTREEIKELPFGELFRNAVPSEIPADVFTLVGEDFTVITSGDMGDHNSMIASWGGWGVLFNKPTTWNFLRANRYTLEYIRRSQTYTMAYFDEEYKNEIMLFGTKSGRDSDKMKRHSLTPVSTPGGNIAYKEARLIIECSLTEITTVSPDDYYTDDGRGFVEEGYADAGDYHKLVFGEITGVWLKK